MLLEGKTLEKLNRLEKRLWSTRRSAGNPYLGMSWERLKKGVERYNRRQGHWFFGWWYRLSGVTRSMMPWLTVYHYIEEDKGDVEEVREAATKIGYGEGVWYLSGKPVEDIARSIEAAKNLKGWRRRWAWYVTGRRQQERGLLHGLALGMVSYLKYHPGEVAQDILETWAKVIAQYHRVSPGLRWVSPLISALRLEAMNSSSAHEEESYSEEELIIEEEEGSSEDERLSKGSVLSGKAAFQAQWSTMQSRLQLYCSSWSEGLASKIKRYEQSSWWERLVLWWRGERPSRQECQQNVVYRLQASMGAFYQHPTLKHYRVVSACMNEVKEHSTFWSRLGQILRQMGEELAPMGFGLAYVLRLGNANGRKGADPHVSARTERDKALQKRLAQGNAFHEIREFERVLGERKQAYAGAWLASERKRCEELTTEIKKERERRKRLWRLTPNELTGESRRRLDRLYQGWIEMQAVYQEGGDKKRLEELRTLYRIVKERLSGLMCIPMFSKAEFSEAKEAVVKEIEQIFSVNTPTLLNAIENTNLKVAMKALFKDYKAESLKRLRKAQPNKIPYLYDVRPLSLSKEDAPSAFKWHAEYLFHYYRIMMSAYSLALFHMTPCYRREGLGEWQEALAKGVPLAVMTKRLQGVRKQLLVHCHPDKKNRIGEERYRYVKNIVEEVNSLHRHWEAGCRRGQFVKNDKTGEEWYEWKKGKNEDQAKISYLADDIMLCHYGGAKKRAHREQRLSKFMKNDITIIKIGLELEAERAREKALDQEIEKKNQEIEKKDQEIEKKDQEIEKKEEIILEQQKKLKELEKLLRQKKKLMGETQKLSLKSLARKRGEDSFFSERPKNKTEGSSHRERPATVQLAQRKS